MEEYKINLAAIDKEYNNKTFRYRINGFADACGMMDIDEFVPNSKKVFKENTDMSFRYKYKYYITSHMDSYVEEQAPWQIYESHKILRLSGRYDYLKFSFTNSKYSLQNHNYNGKENAYVQFSLRIEKEMKDYVYKLAITPVMGINPLYKYRFVKESKTGEIIEEIRFTKFSIDFSKVLKLIKIYVSNPELVFNKFKEKEGIKKSKLLNEIIIPEENTTKKKLFQRENYYGK